MPVTPETDEIRHVLEDLETWAVVGCSADPWRDSHGVASFLQQRGKTVIPVNPSEDEILGQQVHPDLASVPADAGIEVVDIFRRSDAAGAHVDEAIAIGAKAVWLQLGVIDEAAAARARDAGLIVVMDRCPKIEWPRIRR
jgi:uncharacterized protein